MATSQTPLVLEKITLPAFIQYILKNHAAPSTLMICSSRGAFLRQLQETIAAETQDQEIASRPQQSWTTPTLRLLASSRTVNLIFCPELPHLRAYLAAYTHRLSAKALDLESSVPVAGKQRILAILNPIQLHRETSAYSAQGLNRTFATAVEAAHQTGSRLVMAECPSPTSTQRPEGYDIQMDLGAEDAGVARGGADTNPWDEELSMLNVTTKSFGAGERGWVGRTVKVRTVAGRWCHFQDMHGEGT